MSIPEKPQVKDNSSSVDLSARVLLLETKILFLETKFKVLEAEIIKPIEVKPQPTIYGANRKFKNSE